MSAQKQISWFLFFLMLGLICGFSLEASAAEKDPNNEDYFAMSLEELMNTEISGSGSLTKTTRRKVPATMTTITKEDIQRTGARSLDELLLITVPGLQKQFHRYEYEHIGIRGIMSDREDKYLLLVNGRLMNERFFYGAMAERDLPMLKDIHHIDVIRGPGSSIYGPGAIGMVINITTDSGLTFEGLEATARLGSIEEYYSGEFKYGHRIADDEGVFLYGGLSHYPGASGDDAQRVRSDWLLNGEKVYGEYGFGNRATIPRVKVHAQYNRGGLETWIRYTQGGNYRYTADTPWDPQPGQSAEYPPDADAYRKFTAYVSNRFEISPTLAITPSISFDTHQDYEVYRMEKANSWRRDEINTKLMLDWTPNDNHQVTVGGEWSHAINNLRGSWTDVIPDSDLSDIGESSFYTDLTSFMGEYQWRMSDAWTMFLGARLDWHNYLPDKKKMFSPRAALVWTPDKKNTVKLMYTESSRANTDSTLRQGYILHEADNTVSDRTDVETLKAYELRYERQHTNKLWLAGSLFYHIHNPVAYGDTASGGRIMQLGTIRSIGAEFEASYRTDRMRIIFSHSYTKLLGFSLAGNVTKQYYTGGGVTDFASYDNHSTKLRAEYDVTSRLSIDGSVQVYWGCPGKRGWIKEQQQYWGADGVRNSKTMYDGGAFLNLGAQYKANKNLLVRFDAYNIMGFFDKDINAVKVHTEGNEEYWIVSPAFGVSVTYTF